MDTYVKSEPVFVVGPHRSGTSHLRKCISNALNIPSYTEGYVWPIVDAADRKIDFIMNDILGGEESGVGGNFSIKQFKRKLILDSIIKSLDQIHQEKFKNYIWLDKTPGEEMISILPRVIEYFEKGKIIFIKRNGIDNVLSRERRFPRQPFEEHCKGWANTINTWQAIKKELKAGSFIELDQKEMAANPSDVADKIMIFLGIEDLQKKQSLLESLSGTTENTSKKSLDPSIQISLEDVKWDEEKIFTFLYYCYLPMQALSYPLFKNNSELKSITKISKNTNKWCHVSDNLNKYTGHVIHPNDIDESQPEVAFIDIDISEKKSLYLLIKCNNQTIANPGTIIQLEVSNVYTGQLILIKEIAIYGDKCYDNHFELPPSDNRINVKIKTALPKWAESNNHTGVSFQLWFEK